MSSEKLATTMNSKRIFPNRKYKYRKGDLIINWGSRTIPNWYNDNIAMLNRPASVARAVNKLETFRYLTWNGVPTVEWTTKRDEAEGWFYNGETVVERHSVNGYGGSGIRVCKLLDMENGNEISEAPLYTKFIEKAREYRVHVFQGTVFDIQQKKRRSGENTDGTIKNKNSGWVFVRNITTPPSDIKDVAINAIKALGLDFGGVDILTKDGKCYVLEVNTAVGMQGTTLLKYTNIFKEYAKYK